ncbi:MAG: transglycosylase SLT domain-containing protein [Gammaproteobacteria bacterium]
MNKLFVNFKIFNRFRTLLVCLAGVGGLLLSVSIEANIDLQRRLFNDASYALNTGQIKRFNRLFKQLEGYPARAYLTYDAFKNRMKRVSIEEMTRFFEMHEDYPFSYRLRAAWLSELARRQDWKNYLRFFDKRDDTRLQCLAFQARLQLGQVDNINSEIEKIWLRGYSQPRECNQGFEYFLDTNKEARQVIWLRIEKAFNARRPNLAKYLKKRLDSADQAVVDTWYQAHRRPEKFLGTVSNLGDSVRNNKIIAHAIDRLARKDSLKARDFWGQLENAYTFSPEQKDTIVKRIALSAARQQLPEARGLLSELPAKLKNDQAYLMLARILLREQDWAGLVETIKQMPERLQREHEWQFWLARAFESLGYQAISTEKFESLAGKSSYYGFLAADRLQISYRIEQENAATTDDFDEAALLASNIYMLRARELFFLDRPVDARREWFQALRRLDTEQLKQAATLASSWKWYDSAIKTVARTPHRSDYALRFPMPYKQQVLSYTSAKHLDPSVIYGVMRRESLFDPLAKSGVGALGLMQIMPSTARHVAKSLGLRRPRQADILKIDNNINFGTYYFRSVLDRFENNVVLAAAAYNAGPLNVRRWLPSKDGMPADLWVETVPFKETRDYVQAVLAYATVFDKSLNRDTLISSRLLDIKSKY